MKRETILLDGTPGKESFWAIINDYDLHASICELIDRALDIHLKGPQLQPVNIRVDLAAPRNGRDRHFWRGHQMFEGHVIQAIQTLTDLEM